MGMAIFEKSGTFNPNTYGLEIGDIIQIVCVGGGNGGERGDGNGGGDGGAAAPADPAVRKKLPKKAGWT